jgi:integrase
MARTIGRLTDLLVRRANKPGLYSDGGGLYLQIARNGSKSWIFRYGPQGCRYHGLGPVHTVGLSDARAGARECRQVLLNGGDPIGAKRRRELDAKLEAAKTMTFAQAADACIKAHSSGWRNPKHRQQWEHTLRDYAGPVIGSLPVAEIDTGLVMRVLQPIWTEVPETASRLRLRIERVLNWATTMGYRTGENPARWRGHLDQLLPPQSKVTNVKHHEAMPYAELPAFLTELHERTGLAARMLEFVILTAARTGEATGATWSEIDLVNATWTVPESRMKGGREHRVPLPDHAVQILRELPRSGGRIFPLGDKSMLKLLTRMGRRGVTVHGFRAAFKTWASDQTSFQNEIVEKALAHTVGSKVEQAYQRGDLFEKRRRLMAQWSAFCFTPRPRQAGGVVPLRRG